MLFRKEGIKIKNSLHSLKKSSIFDVYPKDVRFVAARRL